MKMSLIKDWKDIITKVGDNQSLLQSLKDSPYFQGVRLSFRNCA
jgi:dynein heavy chain 2